MYNEITRNHSHPTPRQTNKRNPKKNNRKKRVLRKLVLYVVRIDVNDDMTCAKPCKYCTNTMKCIGVKKIIYSDWGGKFTMEHVEKTYTEHLSVFQIDLAERYKYHRVHVTKCIRI